MLKTKIDTVKKNFLDALEQIQTLEDLEQIQGEYLGRKGHVKTLLNELKKLTIEQKREIGPLVSDLRQFCQDTLSHRETQIKDALERKRIERQAAFDVTASYAPERRPGLHPMTRVVETVEDIFISMGFERAYTPEVETEYHNFDALNIPHHHPARDLQDTFWLAQNRLLLRTHTSPAQIHMMESKEPPLAVFSPGRVYRNEATDASHDYAFWQVEAFFVDKNVSLAHLFGTAQQFLQTLFGDERLKIRTRPAYYPFVEPGVDFDMSCPFCVAGCTICSRTQWIEICGAGLIHPNVFSSCGIDPTVWSGFAFGMGLTRLLILKDRIPDVRLLNSSRLDFLTQF